MSMRVSANCSLATLAGAAMLALSLSPASAFTLSEPSLSNPAAFSQIDKVWWDRWGNWHPNRHRVDDPSQGDDGARRCWTSFNGVVHCRSY